MMRFEDMRETPRRSSGPRFARWSLCATRLPRARPHKPACASSFLGAHHDRRQSRAPVQQIAQFKIDRIDFARGIRRAMLACFCLCHPSMPSRSDRANASISASLAWFSISRTNALPTTTPSAIFATAPACSGVEMPKPDRQRQIGGPAHGFDQRPERIRQRRPLARDAGARNQIHKTRRIFVPRASTAPACWWARPETPCRAPPRASTSRRARLLRRSDR